MRSGDIEKQRGQVYVGCNDPQRLAPGEHRSRNRGAVDDGLDGFGAHQGLYCLAVVEPKYAQIRIAALEIRDVDRGHPVAALGERRPQRHADQPCAAGDEDAHRQSATMPPSTLRSAPAIKDEPAEQRKSMLAAT